jgi:hypothetical protein
MCSFGAAFCVSGVRCEVFSEPVHFWGAGSIGCGTVQWIVKRGRLKWNYSRNNPTSLPCNPFCTRNLCVTLYCYDIRNWIVGFCILLRVYTTCFGPFFCGHPQVYHNHILRLLLSLTDPLTTSDSSGSVRDSSNLSIWLWYTWGWPPKRGRNMSYRLI